ncbi:cytidine deaminase [bacterium]|jgi:cytidine deaminase|nr:cytidine deaminase [bacterium]
MTSHTIKTLSPEIQKLFELACRTRENAYVIYSQYQVGAALLLSNGEMVGGCNVENASYGATVCAERVAIQKAISDRGKIEVKKVMVVTDSESPWPPCGMCRQVIAEFTSDDAEIYLANLQGQCLKYSFQEIFPGAFRNNYMKD